MRPKDAISYSTRKRLRRYLDKNLFQRFLHDFDASKGRNFL